jgi:phage terminase large subunit-like protein
MTSTSTDALETAQRATALATLARLREIAGNPNLTEGEAREVISRIRALLRRIRASHWEPYVWQHPHLHPDGWVSTRAPGVCDERCAELPAYQLGVHEVWLQRGGRGTGKTEGAAHYVNAHVEGPACDPRVPGGHRLTIVAPTQPDAVSSCVTGVTGLQAVNPGVTVATTKEGTLVRWPNGAVGRVLGAHDAQDVERARAWTNVCVWWMEEAAAQNELGGMLEQAPFTLRLGDRPHLVATTTPKTRPEIKALIHGDTALPHIPRAVVQTWGRTRDADRLPAPIVDSLERMYGGTTLGQQELDGDEIADVAGALWVQQRPDTVGGFPNPDDRPGIDNDRLPAGYVGWQPHGPISELPDLARPLLARFPAPPEHPVITGARIVIGVDPAGGATENGISVLAEHLGHGYTLGDYSLTAGPDMWGKIAVLAWYLFGAEGIAMERTYGGDQTQHVIDTAAEALGLPVPAALRAPTVEGKKQRAIPLQALAQQHRLHHVGRFPGLESEQTTWVEGVTKESPNRLDAWVHAGRHLLVRAKPGNLQTPRGHRMQSTSAAWGSTRRR